MTVPLTQSPATTPEPPSGARYTLDNGWDAARQRLDRLEEGYDPGAIRRLTGIGVAPGWR